MAHKEFGSPALPGDFLFYKVYMEEGGPRVPTELSRDTYVFKMMPELNSDP